jgi:hypothetical protein
LVALFVLNWGGGGEGLLLYGYQLVCRPSPRGTWP